MLKQVTSRAATGEPRTARLFEVSRRGQLARHVFVAGDVAQIVLDWSIDGTGPDGEHVHLGGSASDVVRRGADGLWRYLIDNNQGTAVRQPA